MAPGPPAQAAALAALDDAVEEAAGADWWQDKDTAVAAAAKPGAAAPGPTPQAVAEENAAPFESVERKVIDAGAAAHAGPDVMRL